MTGLLLIKIWICPGMVMKCVKHFSKPNHITLNVTRKRVRGEHPLYLLDTHLDSCNPCFVQITHQAQSHGLQSVIYFKQVHHSSLKINVFIVNIQQFNVCRSMPWPKSSCNFISTKMKCICGNVNIYDCMMHLHRSPFSLFGWLAIIPSFQGHLCRN